MAGGLSGDTNSVSGGGLLPFNRQQTDVVVALCCSLAEDVDFRSCVTIPGEDVAEGREGLHSWTSGKRGASPCTHS